MRIKGKHYRTIWFDGPEVSIIDQRKLPFSLSVENITDSNQMAEAIRDMHVRGAPLIGVAAAAGAYLAARTMSLSHKTADKKSIAEFNDRINTIRETRPTAVNLAWALTKQSAILKEGMPWDEVASAMLHQAKDLADKDVAVSEAIGRHGLKLIKEIAQKKNGGIVQILTHCNAGWLATIDFGTATAPVYSAHNAGINLHVWVDETRPRLQGSRLTAYELSEEGVPHTIISDNTGGHLMQHGEVDLCIVGTDRTTRRGDVANKIGTYLKALAAKHNQVPFYVAAPSSSIDWAISDGLREIEMEERNSDEILYVEGEQNDKISSVRIAPHGSPAKNYGFDVTPAELVTGIITERGICPASEEGLLALFPEHKNKE